MMVLTPHATMCRFETRHMERVVDIVKSNRLHHSINTMGCTGGGAYKFSEMFHVRAETWIVSYHIHADAATPLPACLPAHSSHHHTTPQRHHHQERLGITLRKMDELECLMRGLEFVLVHVVGECYTYKPDRAPNPVRYLRMKTFPRPSVLHAY